MSLQYLEALKALGAGPSTKFVIPLEYTRLLEPFLDYLTPGDRGSGGGQGDAPRRVTPPAAPRIAPAETPAPPTVPSPEPPPAPGGSAPTG